MKTLQTVVSLLAFMIAFSSLKGEAHPGSDQSATVASSVEPPDYPDSVHVANGCFLSAVAYLAKFTANFPHERGELAPIMAWTRDRRGRICRKPHTIVLLTWHGRWWLRDEFFGVAPIGAVVRPNIDRARLVRDAEVITERHSEALVIAGKIPPPPLVPHPLPLDRRLSEIETATRIPLPASEVFLVRSGGIDVPMLFFRPQPGMIAVYDPAHGTAQAECSSSDPGRVVAAVAQKLGYAVESVRVGYLLPRIRAHVLQSHYMRGA